MKTAWTKGLDKEAQKEVKGNYLEGRVLRNRLTDLLKEKQESSVRNSHSKEGYENPNWAYIQADARGYERALQEIINLVCDK